MQVQMLVGAPAICFSLVQLASASLTTLQQHTKSAAAVRAFVRKQAGISVEAGWTECMRPLLQDLLDKHSFVRLLAAVNRQGLILVMQALQRGEQVHRDALDALHDILIALMTFFQGWHLTAPASGGLSAADKLAVVKQVMASGMLPTIMDASSYATCALQLLAQRQAQQQQAAGAGPDNTAIVHLAYTCMCLYDGITAMWPGKIMVGPAVGACAEPVCSMVLAVLALDAPADLSSTSSGSSSSNSGRCNTPPLGDDLAQLQAAAVATAALLVRRLFEDFEDTKFSARVDPQVVARLGSGSMFKLVLAALAIVTGSWHGQQQQQQQQQRQQQQRQQQELPQPHHALLLGVLGIPWRQAFARVPDLPFIGFYAPLYVASLVLHPAVREAAAHAGPTAAAAGSGTNSSGSRSGAGSTGNAHSTSSGSPEAAGVAAAAPVANNRAVYAALLLTVLQYALQQEGPAELVSAAYMLMQMLSFLQADEAAFKVATVELVQPLFLELAPALLRAYAAGWPNVNAQAGAAAEVVGEAAFALNSEAALPRLILMMFRRVDVWPRVLEVMLQHPSQVCQAVEAAVRAAARGGSLQTATDISNYACFVAAGAVRMKQPSWAASGPAANHAFAMRVTCLKAVSAISSCDSDRLQTYRQSILCLHEAAAPVAEAAAQQGQEQQEHWVLQQQQQQLLLLGRTLVAVSSVTAMLIQDIAAGVIDAAASIASDKRDPYIIDCGLLEMCWGVCQQLLQALQHGLSSGLQLPGEPAAAEQAQQQLLKQHEGLQQQVEQQLQQARQLLDKANRQQDSGSSSSCSSVAFGVCFDRASQLQAFASAVCSQVPMGLLCCNPACSNFSKKSELDLVGGKGCVCANCLTARFCSKGCLEQCWKHQHRPVCKRIAAGHTQQQQQP